MDEPRQLLEFAQQFFSIANTITAFSVFQAVALMYAFKDAKLAAAFLRWRPYTSLLAKHAGNGYIIAVISCGIAEFWLRYVAYQPRVANQPSEVAMLGACVPCSYAQMRGNLSDRLSLPSDLCRSLSRTELA